MDEKTCSGTGFFSIQTSAKVVILQPDAERLRHFDQLVVLSNGRLVESGKPEEVMKSQARSVDTTVRWDIC